MAQKRLPMRNVRKILQFHFDEGRSARAIAPSEQARARDKLGETPFDYAKKNTKLAGTDAYRRLDDARFR